MTTSLRGIDLIKRFEGLSLRAVRLPGEPHYTIGYGHYGADVREGQRVTREEAEALLRQDLAETERSVGCYCARFARFTPNQNQFDALVSFCYNCGANNLYTLVRDRTAAETAAHMTAYVHSYSEAYRQGLTNRRNAERALFLTPAEEDEAMERWNSLEEVPAGYYRDQAKKYVEAGVLNGEGGQLDLTKDMLRTLIMAERLLGARE